MSDRIQSRAWCFTLNNFKDHGWEHWHPRLKSLEGVAYLICEEEVGEQGTPHLQGYIRFKTPRDFTSLQHFFEGYAHIEKAKGNDNQSKEYCSKDGVNVLEIGKPRDKGGSRINWDGLFNDFNNMNINDFHIKYPKESVLHLNKLINLQNRIYQSGSQTCYDGSLKSKNYWIYGAPGTGKSRWARHQCSSIYLKACNKWWSGYESTYQMVLMEDFPPFEQTKGILGQHMKVWADRYTFTAETKGGHMFVHPKDFIFVVTSNYSIDECFGANDADAIKRRFNELYVVPNDFLFSMVMETTDILRGNCDEDHAVHCT